MSGSLLYIVFILLVWFPAGQEDGAARPAGGGAGALVTLSNRLRVFVAELEPLVPDVRHSNR